MKRLMLLGVLPECPETYNNVRVLIKHLQLEGIKTLFSGDLKICKNVKSIDFRNYFI